MFATVLVLTLALASALNEAAPCTAPRRLDGRCGLKFGNATCIRAPSDTLYKYSLTECCSSLYFCGNTADHCTNSVCPKPTPPTPAPKPTPTPSPTTTNKCTFSQPGELSKDAQKVLLAIFLSADDTMINLKVSGKDIWSYRLLWLSPSDGWYACRLCLFNATANGYGTATCDVWANLANFKAGYK